MAVSDGQPVNASVVNSNFLSKVDTTTETISILSLNNSDTASGDPIPNVQGAINNKTFSMFAEQVVLSAGTINISTSLGLQYRRVSGDSGAITTSTTPFGTTAPVAGTIVRVVGFNNTNTVTIQNNDIAFGTILNGNATLDLYDVLDLQYDEVASRWVEISRNF